MHPTKSWRNRSDASRQLTSAALVFWLGCSVAPETKPSEHTVKALWNPADSILPTPTDLLRDDVAGRLKLPTDGDITAADREFRGFLNSLDGYPLSTSVEIPFSAALDPSTVDGNIILIDVEANAAVPFSIRIDALSHDITLKPVDNSGEDISFQHGKTYVYAVRGYEHGARGLRGDTLVADAAFFFVRSRETLTDHLDAIPGDSQEDKLETADKLEEVRQKLAPWFEVVLDHGWPREHVAVLGSFTTVSFRPVVSFDPPAKEIPFPNNLLLDLETGLIDLPIPDDATESEMNILNTLSTYDGFSASAAIIIKTNTPVDRESVIKPEVLRVFRIDGEIAEVTNLKRDVADDSMSFWAEPELTLEHSSRYAYVVTRQGRAASGKPLESDIFAAFLRMRSPLFVDGHSQLGVLSDEDAKKVDAARQELQPLLAHLELLGVRPSDISAAVPFRTISAPKTIVGMRQQLYTQNISTTISETLAKTPWDRGLYLLMPQVKTIVSGKMPILDHIDPYTSSFRDSGDAVVNTVDFILTIPKGYHFGEPIPVVLFGHGLETSRELVYMIANRLATGGFAAFSMDLPYHGERSACRNDLECYGSATCYADSTCRYSDGTFGRLRAVSSPWPDGPSYPVTSGLYFVEPKNLVASRDHFLQALLDLAQGVRVIREADWESASGGYTLDGNDMVYLGMSLGGILGSNLAVIESHLQTFALNVPGAGLVELMQDSVLFGPLLDLGLNHNGIERDTPEFFTFANASRWLLDPIEPLNFAHHVALPMGSSPLDSDNKFHGKRVLLQKAQGDLVIPNTATDRLGLRSGLDVSNYTPLISNHVFLFDPTSVQGAQARDEIMEFFGGR